MRQNDFHIGFVGVGRMGANIARHVHDEGYDVTAIYDVVPEPTAQLAAEIGCRHASSPADVAETSDTVNHRCDRRRSDGQNLRRERRCLPPEECRGPVVHQLCHGHAERSRGGAGARGTARRSQPRSVHGEQHHPGPRRHALPHVRRPSRSVQRHGAAAGIDQPQRAVHRPSGCSSTDESPRQHGDEHQHGGARGGSGPGRGTRAGPRHAPAGVLSTGAASRVLETDGEEMQSRDHEYYFSAAQAAKDSGIALALTKTAGLSLPLSRATLEQYGRLVELDRGELDKSGVSELTFKGRTA